LAGTFITPMAVAYLRRRNARQSLCGQRKEEDGGEAGIVRTVGFWGVVSQFLCQVKIVECHAADMYLIPSSSSRYLSSSSFGTSHPSPAHQSHHAAPLNPVPQHPTVSSPRSFSSPSSRSPRSVIGYTSSWCKNSNKSRSPLPSAPPLPAPSNRSALSSNCATGPLPWYGVSPKAFGGWH
jgi:hypothetical protein